MKTTKTLLFSMEDERIGKKGRWCEEAPAFLVDYVESRHYSCYNLVKLKVVGDGFDEDGKLCYYAELGVFYANMPGCDHEGWVYDLCELSEEEYEKLAFLCNMEVWNYAKA